MRLVNARESAELIRPLVFGLIIKLIDQILTPMSVLSAPPQPGGSGTFSITTWNIRSGRGTGLAAAAKGLRQMDVGCAVFTETKLTDDRYPKFVSGYQVISSKAASPHQGGISLLWRESEDQGFLVPPRTSSPSSSSRGRIDSSS
jgi:hypothetical protein